MKTCSKCKEVLELDGFATDRTKAIGVKSLCKSCDRAKSRRYYQANREAVIARVRLAQVRRAERERAA